MDILGDLEKQVKKQPNDLLGTLENQVKSNPMQPFSTNPRDFKPKTPYKKPSNSFSNVNKGLWTLGKFGTDYLIGFPTALAGGISTGVGATASGIQSVFDKEGAKKTSNFFKDVSKNTTFAKDYLSKAVDTTYGKYGNIQNPESNIVGQVAGAVGSLASPIGTIKLGGKLVSNSDKLIKSLKLGTKSAKKVKKIASMTPFMVQVAGNSSVQAVKEGAELEEAVDYGLKKGIMEGLINSVSGGLGGVQGNKILSKLPTKGISKGLSKVGDFAIDVGGEGIEEVISTYIDPLLKRMTYDEKAELATSKEAMDSFVMGALSSSILKTGKSALDFKLPTKLPTKPTETTPVKSSQPRTDTLTTKTTTDTPKVKKTVKMLTLPSGEQVRDTLKVRNQLSLDSTIPLNITSKQELTKQPTVKTEEVNKLTDNGITMTYVRNPNTKTDYYGEIFGQNLEPKGEYMNLDTLKGSNKIDNLEYGTIKFNKPLVLEHKNTGNTGWKKDLSDKYNGLVGNKLSNAIKKDGYDAIITVDDDGNYSEIVNLKGIKLDNETISNSKPIKQPTIKSKDVKPIKPKEIQSGKVDIDKVKDIRKNPDLVKDKVAMRTLKSGKQIPAVRNSGVFAPKEFETQGFKDIKGNFGQRSYNFLAAAGEFDNLTTSKVAEKGDWGAMTKLRHEADSTVAQRTEYTTNKIQDIKSLAKKYNIPINEKTGAQLFDALEGRADTKEMQNLANDIRAELDNLRKEANKVRKALGKKEIGYIENYAPHMQQTNFWKDMMGDKRTEISDNFDFIIPNAKKNPHAISRTDATFEKEKNMWKLLDGYINATSNDIYTSPLIEKIKAVNSVIMPTHPNMSNFLNSYVKENLVGQSASIDSMFGVKPGSKKKAVAEKIMMARNTSALAGNFVWNLVTQPASITNTVSRAGGLTRGLQNTVGGVIDYVSNKDIKSQVDKLPSMQIKSKGKTVARTAGGDVDRISARLNETKLDKFNDFLSIVSDGMENILTGSSAAAGYREAKALGLEGKSADIYADMVAQTTQSMYNKEARPVIMNNVTMRFGAPFQTFAFEQYRYAKQLMGKGGGIPLEKRERLSQAIMLLISTGLYGLYAQRVAGRQLNTVGTYIPIVGSVVDSGINKVAQTVGLKEDEYSSAGRSPVAPLEDVKRAWDSIDAIVKYNNWQPMRKEMIKWGMGFAGVGGASSLNRFIDGAIASTKGYQETRSGRVAFPIEGNVEKLKSMTLGTYSTKAGRQYIDNNFKSFGEKQTEFIKQLSENNVKPSQTIKYIEKAKEIDNKESLKGITGAKRNEKAELILKGNYTPKQKEIMLDSILTEAQKESILNDKSGLSKLQLQEYYATITGNKTEKVDKILKSNLKDKEKLLSLATDIPVNEISKYTIKTYMNLTDKRKEDFKTFKKLGIKENQLVKYYDNISKLNGKDEVFKYINKLNLTKGDKLILFASNGYKVNENELFEYINKKTISAKEKRQLYDSLK